MRRRSFLGMMAGATPLAGAVIQAYTHVAKKHEPLYPAAVLPPIVEPANCMQFSLHTADPGDVGRHETTYEGYHRLFVPRSDEYFVIEGNRVRNTKLMSFPMCHSGLHVITHFAMWMQWGDQTHVMCHGPIAVHAVLDEGVSLQLAVDLTLFPEY